MAVFRLGSDVPVGGGRVGLDVTDSLAVASRAPAVYSAAISLHREGYEAIQGENPLPRRLAGGEAVVVETVSGVDDEVTPAPVAADLQPVPALPGRRSGPGVPDPIERDAPHRQGAVRAHPGEQPAGRLGRRGCDGEGDFSLGAFDRVPVEEACPDRVGTAAARGKGAFDGGSRSWQR